MVGTKQTSLKLNIILNMILQVINMLAPLITTPYVSRVLGVNQIGVYSYYFSLNYYLVMLAGLGTATYGVVEIAKVRDEKSNRTNAFWAIEFITIITSLFCIAVWLLISVESKQYSLEMLAMTFYLLAVMFDISWFYLGCEKVQYTVFINGLFKILGIVSIYLFVNSKGDLVKYILILSATQFLGNASMWIFLTNFVGRFQITRSNIIYHAKGTMLYFIPTIATSVYTVLDKTLIGAITNDSSQNGYYEQATKIINLIKTVTFSSLNTILGARMSYLFAKHDVQQINSKKKFALNFLLFMAYGCCFGVMGISNNFVPLFFGEEFHDVIYYLILMSPLLVIMGLSNLIGNLYYNPSGRRKQSTVLLVIGCLINIVLNIFFIPAYGGYGAIIATILAELTITTMYVFFSNSFITFHDIFFISFKKLIAASIMLFFLARVSGLFSSMIINLIAQLVVGIITYIAILCFLKDDFVIGCINMIKDRIRGKKR